MYVGSPPGHPCIQKLIIKNFRVFLYRNALFLYIYFFNIMTFNQHVNSIQTLVSAFNLSVIERQNHGLVHDVRGAIDGRQIYICVRYASNTIFWRDQLSGESKTFTF